MLSSNLVCVSILILAVTYLEAAPTNKRRENALIAKTTKQLKVKSMPKDQFVKLQETAENVEVATPKALSQEGVIAVESSDKPADKQDVDVHGLISAAQKTENDAPKIPEKDAKKEKQNVDVIEPKALADPNDMLPLSDDLEISPRAAAEYLLATGDFDSFYAAIDQLVNAHMLTREGADNYNAEVGAELEVLTRLLMDAESAYMQALFPPQDSRLVDQRPAEDSPIQPAPVPYGENGVDSAAAYNRIDDPATMQLLADMMDQYVKDKNSQPVNWAPSEEASAIQQQFGSPKNADKVEEQIKALARAPSNKGKLSAKTPVKEMSA